MDSVNFDHRRKTYKLCFTVLFTFFVKQIMKKPEREGTSRLSIGRQGAG
jgi:hypothetical protein